MNRNDIHNQIATLSEKINHLNKMLSNESALHPVEADLLLGYARELLGMIEQLVSIKSDLKVIKEEVKLDTTPAPPVELKELPVEPVEKEKEEIKLHQRILTQAEQAAPVESDEVAIDTLPEEVKIRSVEEIVIRKKPVTDSLAGKEKTVSLNEKFRKETTALSDKLKGAKKKNIKELFDLNERYKFIEELFGGSSDQFNKAMHDLGKISIQDDARLYIDNIKTKYSWDKKQALAELFSGQVLGFLG